MVLRGAGRAGWGGGAGNVRAMAEPGVQVVRVLPDEPGIGKAFDYTVPAGFPPVGVGDRVRVSLAGRRVGGWVVDADAEPAPGVDLKPLAKWSGRGPVRRPDRPGGLGGLAVGRAAGLVPAHGLARAGRRRPAAGGACRAVAGGRRGGRQGARHRAGGRAGGPGHRPVPAGGGGHHPGQRARAVPDPGARAVDRRPAAARRRRRRHLPRRLGAGGGGRHGRRGPGPRPGRPWATWRPSSWSTSTTRPISRRRRRHGTPATWPPSGRGGPASPACWSRPARRSRPWRGAS